MDILTAVLLGIFQGLFEWLPVSSQGSVFLLAMLLGEEPVDSINIAIFLHLGTVLAAIVFYRKDVTRVVTFKDPALLKFLIIATALTVAVGAPLYLALRHVTPAIGIVSIFIVGIALVVTGSVQLLARRGIARGPALEVEAMDLHLREKHDTLDAVLGGIVQGFSIIPGISRSGSTTSVFLFRKMDQNAALRLSFIMSIPVVLVAQVGLGLLDGITISVETLAGFAASFIVGLVTIKLFTRLAARVSFGPFTIIVGVLACVPVIFLLVM